MEYCVRYIDLPCSVNGVTVPDVDGFYNIYINSRLSLEKQAQALKHELTHIARDDFERADESIYAVENMAL